MSNLDEELAAATDALLSGQNSIQFSDGDQELEVVIRQIYLTIAPDKPPTAEFEQHLAARLNSEWEMLYGRSRLRLLENPLARVAAAAAAVVLILTVALVLAVPPASRQVSGSALSLNVIVAGMALVLFAALVIVLVRSRH